MSKSTTRNALCLTDALESRRLLAAVTFDGGGNGVSWNDPLNWSNNQLPTALDDVTLAPGGEVVQAVGVPVAVKSIQANRPLRVADAFLVIQSAVFNDQLIFSSSTGSPALFLEGSLQTNASVTLNRSTSINFTADFDQSWTGSALVSGAASLSINNNTSFYDPILETTVGFNVTVNSGISFSTNSVSIKPGNASGGSFDNHAPMSVSGGTSRTITVLSMVNTLFTNFAALSATSGATIKLLAPAWHNAGTLSLTGATLTLGGSIATSDIGMIQSENSVVELTGALDNTNATLTLTDLNGQWIQRSTASITGGVITTTGSAYLLALAGVWDDVQLDGNATVSQEQELRVRNGLTINGVLTLGSANQLGHLLFDGEVEQTVDGTGEIHLGTNPIATSCRIENQIFDPNTNTGRALAFDNTLTIDMSRVTFLSSRNGGVINNYGTILVEGEEAGFRITGPFQSEWITHFNNYGVITVTDAEVEFEKITWANYGTITITNCEFEMGGIATGDLGGLHITGGTWSVAGVVNNTGLTFSISSNLYLNGTIRGGTITAVAGAKIICEYGVLDDVTLNAPLEIPYGLYLAVRGNLILNSTITLDESSMDFIDSEDQSFTGTGTVVSMSNEQNFYDIIDNDVYEENLPGKRLTFGAGLHFTGGHFYFANTEPGGVIDNFATLTVSGGQSAMTIGGPETESDNFFHNHGTINATDGAVLNMSMARWTNSGTINLNYSTFNMGGRFHASDYGTVNRTFSTVNIVGRLENTNEVTLLDQSTGNWVIKGGRIVGGVIDTQDSYRFLSDTSPHNGILDGVTVEGLITLASSALLVENGMLLNGTVELGNFTFGSTGGTLTFRGATDQVLRGTGAIISPTYNLGTVKNWTRNPTTNRGLTLTIESGITITGQNLTVTNTNDPDSMIINYATIGSNHPSGLVNFGHQSSNTHVINRGHIYATNGADLTIQNALESLGWIELRGESASGNVTGEYVLDGNIAITEGAIMKFVGAVNGPAAIDLDGSIIFDFPTSTASPVESVGAMIASGYANGAWDGPGIRSSYAAMHPKSALGFADAAVLPGVGGTIATTALSVSYDETSVLVRRTLKGDANLDLTVNFNDLLAIAQNYGQSNSTWVQGDFDYNGTTGFQDLLSVAQNYGSTASSRAPAGIFPAPSRRMADDSVRSSVLF